ncbi:MAG: cytochrome P450 [Actinomycetota bacterium]|nr:cytochrome P450 [Actinomycetota bacterium]
MIETSPPETTQPPPPAPLNELPPGPSMPPGLQMLGFWYRRHAFFESCRAQYGHRFTIRMRVPPQPYVVLSSPDDIKELFSGPPDALWCGDGSLELEKYFGPTGLAFLEGDEHLVRRKQINKSMHGEAVERIAASIAEVTERHVASWPRDEIVELYHRAHRLTIDVVRHVNFGPEPDRRLDELVDSVERLMEFNNSIASMFKTQDWPPRALRALAAFRPSGYKRFLELRERCDRLIYEVVDDRRRAGGDGGGMVGMLLSSTNGDGSPLSTQVVRDEVMTNFLAGTATTAASIGWAVERITREPAVRERLVEEIDAGGDDSYLTATVQEILRRKPPLSGAIPRLVMKPIEIGGVLYPPGTRLMASSYLVHHDASVYPDPYSFRPERFLESPPGLYTWIPFGGGRRRCLGKAIAELELKCVLREIFGQCELRPDSPEPERTRSHIATVRPSRGARVVLHDRA